MIHTMKPIHTMDEFEIVTKNPMSIMVFSATWCPDCRFIEPILPVLIEQYDTYEFYYIDRDECMDICQSLNIFGIPSFVAFSNGQEVGRFASKLRKTKEEINDFLQNLRTREGE